MSPGQKEQALQAHQAEEVCPLPDEGRSRVSALHLLRQGMYVTILLPHVICEFGANEILRHIY